MHLHGGRKAGAAGQASGSIAAVFPTDAELFSALGYHVRTGFAPRVGGVDQLRDLDIRDPSEVENFDCLGVVKPVMRQVYSGAPVSSAAFATEADLVYGAVALTSPTDAQSLFTAFSHQWKQCGGKTVVTHQGHYSTAQQIVRVDATKSMLTATILISSPETTSPPQAWERALGLAANVVVDVSTPQHPGPSNAAPDNPAVSIANVMLAKAVRR